MTKHIHAEAMAEYAKDALKTDEPYRLWECRTKGMSHLHWMQIVTGHPSWNTDLEYRRIDPYRELKEAHAAGKTIQFTDGEVWVDAQICLGFHRPVNEYRIKPEPSSKLVMLLGYLSEMGGFIHMEEGSRNQVEVAGNPAMWKRVPEMDRKVRVQL